MDKSNRLNIKEPGDVLRQAMSAAMKEMSAEKSEKTAYG
jgi:hypothetical protein